MVKMSLLCGEEMVNNKQSWIWLKLKMERKNGWGADMTHFLSTSLVYKSNEGCKRQIDCRLELVVFLFLGFGISFFVSGLEIRCGVRTKGAA